jgi:hypothetical protein
MSNKGYKQLKGIRILLSLPKRDDKGIELSPELKEEMNREYATKMDKLLLVMLLLIFRLEISFMFL